MARIKNIELPCTTVEHWQDANHGDRRAGKITWAAAQEGNLLVQFFVGADERGRKAEIRIPLSDLLTVLPELNDTLREHTEYRHGEAINAAKDAVMDFSQFRLDAKWINDLCQTEDGSTDIEKEIKLEAELEQDIANATELWWPPK